MHAILIAPQNLSKIEEHLSLQEDPPHHLEPFVLGRSTWYYITGYIGSRGEVIHHTFLPAYILEDKYEYDPVKIKTDWDQIVRK